MKVSEKGLELIKAHEGLRLTAYPDPATGGEPFTIGYGCTSAAGVCDVHKGMTITKEQAEEMLLKAIVHYEDVVRLHVTVPLTQEQFDACVSLCWNIGPANFKHSSVVRLLNERRYKEAADAFLMWDKAAHHVLPGLHHRRVAERNRFMGVA